MSSNDFSTKNEHGAYKNVPIFRHGSANGPDDLIGVAHQDSHNPRHWRLDMVEGGQFEAFVQKGDLKYLTLSALITNIKDTGESV